MNAHRQKVAAKTRVGKKLARASKTAKPRARRGNRGRHGATRSWPAAGPAGGTALHAPRGRARRQARSARSIVAENIGTQAPVAADGRLRLFRRINDLPHPAARPVTRSVCPSAPASRSRLFADRLGHRPPRQNADEVSAVFGAAVDVRVHAVGRNGQAFQRFR